MSDDNRDDKETQEVAEEKAPEEENAEEESEESSDDEELVGEFDKPVVVEGKRERKSTSRLTLGDESKPQKEELDYSKGKGVKIGSIDRVKYEMDRTPADKMKPLHKLIFNREGKIHEVKKNIKAFCGFPFDKDSKGYTSREARIERFTVDYMKQMLSMFGLAINGKANDLRERLMAFLLEPYDSGKGLPKPKVKKSKKVSKKKKPAKEKKQKKSSDEVQESSDDEDEDKEMSEEDENETSPEKEEKSPKKEKKEKKEKPVKVSKKEESKKDEKKKTPKKVSKEEKSPKKSASKGDKSKEKQKKITPVKIEKKDKSESKKKKAATPVKTPQKKDVKRKKQQSDDSDSDDEPIAKKLKPAVPSDKELAKVVKEILDGADLETITMKTVCKQVYDKYPELDLTDKKGFIKETVKKIIS